MRHRGASEVVLIILAVIGAVALLAGLGMGLMHMAMMGWMTASGGWIAGLLLALLILAAVVAIVTLLRDRSSPP